MNSSILSVIDYPGCGPLDGAACRGDDVMALGAEKSVIYAIDVVIRAMKEQVSAEERTGGRLRAARRPAASNSVRPWLIGHPSSSIGSASSGRLIGGRRRARENVAYDALPMSPVSPPKLVINAMADELVTPQRVDESNRRACAVVGRIDRLELPEAGHSEVGRNNEGGRRIADRLAGKSTPYTWPVSR
jgi:hypothetical protein